jgi:hypothetical protein
MAALAFDPYLKRYVATCPVCGFKAVRAKRETAEWLLACHTPMHDEPATRGDDGN